MDFGTIPTHTVPKQPSDTSFPTVIPDPPIFQHRGPAGEQAQWVVFALMLILSVAFMFLSWSLPAARRLVHSITTLIVVISTLCYYAMANHSGYVMHHVRFPVHHKGKIPPTYKHLHREVYWVRYFEWALITPLILLDLFFLSGVNGASIFSALSANFIMIFSALFASFSHSKGEKWGW
jgi:bacteriorhodopsin